MKRNHWTYKDYKRYLNSQMDNSERHRFEKEMMADPFNQDALDGLSQITNKEIHDDIPRLWKAINIRSRQTKTLLTGWWAVAAGIVLLAGFGITGYLIFDAGETDLSFGIPLKKEMAIAEEKAKDMQGQQIEEFGPQEEMTDRDSGPSVREIFEIEKEQQAYFEEEPVAEQADKSNTGDNTITGEIAAGKPTIDDESLAPGKVTREVAEGTEKQEETGSFSMVEVTTVKKKVESRDKRTNPVDADQTRLRTKPVSNSASTKREMPVKAVDPTSNDILAMESPKTARKDNAKPAMPEISPEVVNKLKSKILERICPGNLEIGPGTYTIMVSFFVMENDSIGSVVIKDSPGAAFDDEVRLVITTIFNEKEMPADIYKQQGNIIFRLTVEVN